MERNYFNGTTNQYFPSVLYIIIEVVMFHHPNIVGEG